jgi:transcriptional regulator GlxA family with amidase domain
VIIPITAVIQAPLGEELVTLIHTIQNRANGTAATRNRSQAGCHASQNVTNEQYPPLPRTTRIDVGCWATLGSVGRFRPDRGTIAEVARTPAERQHPRQLALPRRVPDQIDRDYAQPLDAEALAKGVNISAGHPSRQFKAAYGGNLVRIQKLR